MTGTESSRRKRVVDSFDFGVCGSPPTPKGGGVQKSLVSPPVPLSKHKLSTGLFLCQMFPSAASPSSVTLIEKHEINHNIY